MNVELAGTPLKSITTSARSAGASSRLNGPSGKAVFPEGSDGSSGIGVVLLCIATAGRKPPSVPTWYIVGPGVPTFASPGMRQIFGIEVHVIEPRLGAVQQPEPDSLWRHAYLRVDASIDQDRIEESLWHDRGWSW